MTDIFISYSRRHRERIEPVINVLRDLCLDVWFDAELQAGDIFSDHIEAHLKRAKCVLVFWSKDAIDKGPSGWVRSEADWALQRSKLIQAQLESVRLPPPFFSSVTVPIDLGGILKANRALTPSDVALLLGRLSAFVRRPGLSYLSAACRTDTDLLSWAARYSDDPIAASDDLARSTLVARLQRVREAESLRIRQSGNLEAELRALVEDTERAPLPYFHSTTNLHLDSTRTRGGGNAAPLWPSSTAAFAALGLDVNVYGLEFYDLAAERDFEGEMPLMVVTGEVRNIGRDTKLVPPVRLTLRDTRGHDVFELVNAMTQRSIEPGAAIAFEFRVEDPPADAVELEATFASFGDVPQSVLSQAKNYETAGELLLDEPVETSLIEPSGAGAYTTVIPVRPAPLPSPAS